MDKRLIITIVAMAALGFLFLSQSNDKKPEYAPAETGQGATTEAGTAAIAPENNGTGGRQARRALESIETLTTGGDDEGFVAEFSTLGGTFRSVKMRRKQYLQLPNAERSAPLPPALEGEIPERYYAAGPLELITTWDPTAYPFQTELDSWDYDGTVRRILRERTEGGKVSAEDPSRLLPPVEGADFATTLPAIRAGDVIEVLAPAGAAGTRKVEAVNGDGSLTVSPAFDAAAKDAPIAYRIVVEGPLDAIYARDKRYAVVEQTEDTIAFVWPNPKTDTSDVWIERRFRVKGAYAVDLVVQVHNLGAEPVKSQPALVVTGFQPPVEGGGLFSGPPPDLRHAACRAGGEFIRGTAQEIIGEPTDAKWTPGGGVDWVGIDSRYFLLAAIPTNIKSGQCRLTSAATSPPLGTLRAAVGLTKSWVLPGVKDACRPAWLESRTDLPVCGEGETPSTGFLSYRLYVGPKDLEHLRAIAGEGTNPQLDDSVDFWIVGVLAKPMVWLLKVFHDWIPHWGVAIILLTILVKLLLLPLTQKSFQSMRQMQKLKPEMEKLKEKHGTDKQKLNTEMMALYKRHKVNPFGGCLPMLLQMPVYIALYRAIYSSVELYQAPLFGWIHDLSAPDPFYVLPLILGVSMFLQQLVMPTAMDSQQARMMKWVMPIMFTVFMLFLPSGLVLYIFVNTLLSMVQQYYIKKKDPDAPRRAVAKA